MLPFPGKFAFEGEIYFAMGLNISIKGKKKKNQLLLVASLTV